MFISLGTHRKWKLNEQIDLLLKRIRELEVIHKKSQAQTIEQELAGLREKLNLQLIEKAKSKLIKGRRTFQEFGNKPGRLLANALRETTTRNHITQIKTLKDELVNSPQKIAQTFKEYYENLYQLKKKSNPINVQKKWEAVREYIEETEMPKLTEEAARELDAPISTEEFIATLKSLNVGKALGQDGYTLSYYRKYAEELAPRFVPAYNSL